MWPHLWPLGAAYPHESSLKIIKFMAAQNPDTHASKSVI